jgi:hypothetical protein
MRSDGHFLYREAKAKRVPKTITIAAAARKRTSRLEALGAASLGVRRIGQGFD